ncbi:thioredoxin-like domain-containing protein [uncultured Algoriphagus sp.]|uniref:TlpA family protein disulfide reductase n=1 Tax=uncultured Algoriphagus sp. TaxID=417365 RepID=UPI0030EC1FE4
MKKTLLTCFLASLCLYGSTLTAQVADSPGADFLHRSSPSVPFGLRDTHRGGETRSDTLPEQNGLVDHSVATGQEGESSSASVGPDPGLGNNAVIWGRVSEYSERSQIQLIVYPDYFFTGAKAPRSNHLFLQLQPGNLMEGGYPKDKSFQYNLAAHGTQWFSLSLNDGNPFMELYRIDPNDSIQLFLDLESSYLVFGGKSREQFKLQQGLFELQREQIANTVPTLWTPNPRKVLENPDFAKQRESALSSAGPVLEIRSRDLELLQELEKLDLYSPSGSLKAYWEYIDSYTGKVSESYLDFFRKEVELREWKNYLNQLSGHLRFARRSGEQGDFLDGLLALSREKLDQAEGSLELDLDKRSAAAMDYFAAKMKLWSAVNDEEPLEGISSINLAYWREKFLVRYFYESFGNIPLAEGRLKDFIADMKYSHFAQELRTLESLKGKGVVIEGFEFLDESGNTLQWDEVAKGEVILIEFWISGCKACVAFNEQTLSVLEEKYEGDPRVQVITVSADFDTELWQRSLQSGRYTQSGFTNLYTGKENRNHPFLIRYGISSFPNRILINREGRFIQTSQVPFLAPDLIALIEHELNQNPPKP